MWLGDHLQGYDIELQEHVAIKFIDSSLMDKQRLAQEIKIMLEIRHPHIIACRYAEHDVHLDDVVGAICVMDLCANGELLDFISFGAFEVLKLASYSLPMCTTIRVVTSNFALFVCRIVWLLRTWLNCFQPCLPFMVRESITDTLNHKPSC